MAGKKRRITFVECPPDLHGMIDAAKYADLVLLMVDGGFGFEMETFEFLNLLQVGQNQGTSNCLVDGAKFNINYRNKPVEAKDCHW